MLTKRGAGSASETELAGFPHHALETYLPKLVRAGERVAICDQLEDPKSTKNCQRGVTELITPGVTSTDGVLDEKSNNFVAALHIDNQIHGLSFSIFQQVSSNSHKEVKRKYRSYSAVGCQRNLGCQTNEEEDCRKLWCRISAYYLEDWVFQENYATDRLQVQFGVASLKGFGITDLHAGIIAGGDLYYLNETEHAQLDHITHIHRLDRECKWMDPFTIRNLN